MPSADLGRSEQNPLHVSSENDADAYVDRLKSNNNEVLSWRCIDTENGLLAYEAYLPTEEYYGTLYFAVCGVYTTTQIPEGYLLQEETEKKRKLVGGFSFQIHILQQFLVQC